MEGTVPFFAQPSAKRRSRSETSMAEAGWKRLLEGWPWFQSEGAFPLATYPEYLPPVRLLRKPYGSWDPVPLNPDDPYGWPVTEYEEELTLRPGLRDVARRVLDRLVRFANGGASPEEAAAYDLDKNPYWPGERIAPPRHERYVLLLPLAMSQT